MTRSLRGLLAGVASLPVFWWLLSELAMLYEMSLVPGSSRADLGDDFGLGILLFFVVTPLSLLASVILGIVVLRRWP